MALIGKQKKLDKNNNGKLDKEDFKMLGKSPSKIPINNNKIKNEVARDTTISGRSMNEGMARKMFNHNFRKFNPGGDVPKANLTQEKNKGGQMQYVYSATVGTSPTEMNSPANGNAFTGAMAKTGGDYDKAKEMLDGMPMMDKPKEGISSRIKSRLGLGK